MSYIKREAVAVEVNPWAGDLSLSVRKGSKTVMMGKGKAIVDTETGELGQEMAAMAITRVIDREEFIKIYEGGISNIFDLNKPSRDLFKAVLNVYLDQKMLGDRVYLNLTVLEQCNYKRSKQTYIQALNVLVNKGFLAEVKNMGGWYWVNPNLFYKGDRMKIIQEFAVKGTEDGRKLEEAQRSVEQNSKQKQITF
jgi:hypothetical protein